MKRIISLLLAFVMILPLTDLAAFADEGGNAMLKIDPYGEGENAVDMVKWYERDGSYYLFLPQNTNVNNAKVFCSGGIKVDDFDVVSGSLAHFFTPGKHFVTIGGKQYPLYVFVSANIPAVYIDTESGSLDYIHESKDHKENAVISIYQNGVKTLDGKTISIKGRGNATWSDSDKKPYNIKFDSKTDLFGMGSAKKWTLMAIASHRVLFMHRRWARTFPLIFTAAMMSTGASSTPQEQGYTTPSITRYADISAP